MKASIHPKTVLGKWSVGLNAFVLIVIAISVIFVLVLGILSFDDHWWDVTVPLLILATLVALVTGITSVVRKNRDRSVLVYLSIVVSILAILFVLLHSLFISD